MACLNTASHAQHAKQTSRRGSATVAHADQHSDVADTCSSSSVTSAESTDDAWPCAPHHTHTFETRSRFGCAKRAARSSLFDEGVVAREVDAALQEPVWKPKPKLSQAVLHQIAFGNLGSETPGASGAATAITAEDWQLDPQHERHAQELQAIIEAGSGGSSSGGGGGGGRATFLPVTAAWAIGCSTASAPDVQCLRGVIKTACEGLLGTRTHQLAPFLAKLRTPDSIRRHLLTVLASQRRARCVFWLGDVATKRTEVDTLAAAVKGLNQGLFSGATFVVVANSAARAAAVKQGGVDVVTPPSSCYLNHAGSAACMTFTDGPVPCWQWARVPTCSSFGIVKARHRAANSGGHARTQPQSTWLSSQRRHGGISAPASARAPRTASTHTASMHDDTSDESDGESELSPPPRVRPAARRLASTHDGADLVCSQDDSGAGADRRTSLCSSGSSGVDVDFLRNCSESDSDSDSNSDPDPDPQARRSRAGAARPDSPVTPVWTTPPACTRPSSLGAHRDSFSGFIEDCSEDEALAGPTPNLASTLASGAVGRRTSHRGAATSSKHNSTCSRDSVYSGFVPAAEDASSSNPRGGYVALARTSGVQRHRGSGCGFLYDDDQVV